MVMTAVRSSMAIARTKPRSTTLTPKSGSITSDSAAQTAREVAEKDSPTGQRARRTGQVERAARVVRAGRWSGAGQPGGGDPYGQAGLWIQSAAP
jgi:hypothetical protein